MLMLIMYVTGFIHEQVVEQLMKLQLKAYNFKSNSAFFITPWKLVSSVHPRVT